MSILTRATGPASGIFSSNTQGIFRKENWCTIRHRREVNSSHNSNGIDCDTVPYLMTWIAEMRRIKRNPQRLQWSSADCRNPEDPACHTTSDTCLEIKTAPANVRSMNIHFFDDVQLLMKWSISISANSNTKHGAYYGFIHSVDVFKDSKHKIKGRFTFNCGLKETGFGAFQSDRRYENVETFSRGPCFRHCRIRIVRFV